MSIRRMTKMDLAIAALLMVIAAASGCGHNVKASNETSYTSTPARGDQPHLFTVPAEQMSHIKLMTVSTAPLQRVLRLPGQVAFNAFKTTPVISQISGPVGRILVAPGDVVKRGQPMLYVSSPDFAQLRANYMKARDAHTLAHKNYARAEDLYEHHAIAQRDLEAAESAEYQARADLESAEQALQILGVPKPDVLTGEKVSPEIPVLAPIGGEVVERQVAPGQLLQASTTQCFTISDMSTVWVLVNVYQSDVAAVHVGDRVSIVAEGYGTEFQGKISYVGAALDPNTRTLQARIVTQNPGERLKNNMYVTALVHAGTQQNAITVPDSAVLRNGENEPFVYVEAEPGRFAQQLVKLGSSEGGQTQIIDGLKPGTRIVADGSLFLQFQNSLQQSGE